MPPEGDYPLLGPASTLNANANEFQFLLREIAYGPAASDNSLKKQKKGAQLRTPFPFGDFPAYTVLSTLWPLSGGISGWVTSSVGAVLGPPRPTPTRAGRSTRSPILKPTCIT